MNRDAEVVAELVEARYQRHLHRTRRQRREERKPTRLSNGVTVLVTVYALIAVPATVLGWFAGIGMQGLVLGTMAYAVLIVGLSVYGWHTRRRA